MNNTGNIAIADQRHTRTGLTHFGYNLSMAWAVKNTHIHQLNTDTFGFRQRFDIICRISI